MSINTNAFIFEFNNTAINMARQILIGTDINVYFTVFAKTLGISGSENSLHNYLIQSIPTYQKHLN